MIFITRTLIFQSQNILRIKRFQVTLNTQDIKFMKSRVTMAKKYLIAKEKRRFEAN